MTSQVDLKGLQAAYKAWDASKGSDGGAWLALMADNVRLTSMGNDAPGLMFAKAGTAKDHVVAYLTGLTRDWSMIYWRPETFVTEGDCCAVFGQCAWINKATGKKAEIRTAHLWRFEGGKVAELTEVFDSARAVAAATA